ncbi:hypothetical protein [Lentzea jiangxiensis]|uniref:Uncharacterized protein n=1 Tax=Lentzea jiangxiensis TaxID=641025 RepID=A0A1H0VTU8_9PSEU|nr:hypothetical protein [Lentzea jiangxiensis]SDP81648.1 hypothetical protein SAMN05421507_115130 [Lentzea jiangxiensis]
MAAALFLVIDEQLANGGILPRSWDDAQPRPASPEDVELPIVEIDGDSLICPVCRAKDTVQEKDQAIRWNDLWVSDGVIFGGLGNTDFAHSRFTSRSCDADLALPSEVADYS